MEPSFVCRIWWTELNEYWETGEGNVFIVSDKEHQEWPRSWHPTPQTMSEDGGTNRTKSFKGHVVDAAARKW